MMTMHWDNGYGKLMGNAHPSEYKMAVKECTLRTYAHSNTQCCILLKQIKIYVILSYARIEIVDYGRREGFAYCLEFAEAYFFGHLAKPIRLRFARTSR